MGGDWETHIQLFVNIGPIPQQSVHRLCVSILGRDSECCATILQGSSKCYTLFPLVPICFLLRNCRSMIWSHSFPKPEAMSEVRGSYGALLLYLCLEFSGGAKLKEELHNVIVTLLGSEEEGGRACLEKVTKIADAASCSEGNCFLFV